MEHARAVSATGYDAWHARPENRSVSARTVLSAIQVIHRESREISGSLSIWEALPLRGPSDDEHRVARLMRQDGLRAESAENGLTESSDH